MMPLAGPVLTAAAMRAAEDRVIAAGTSVDELMARAGAAVAEQVWRFGAGQAVLVICGPGNNGGDGYVAAALLKARGVHVRVAATGEPKTDVAKRARTLWDAPVEALGEAAPAAFLVDALFGTGLTRALEPETAAALTRLAQAAHFVFAVDLPSGVGSDDGARLGGVAAQATLALGALKPAHLLEPARALCGQVQVAAIGITAQSETHVADAPCFAAPARDAHKYSRGMLGIIGGTMPGAAALAAGAAARLAGYIVLSGDGPITPHAIVRRDAAQIIGETRLDALLIGPGLGRDGQALLDAALASPHPLVLDGDALTLLGHGVDRLAARAAPTILTPHAGEFERMFGNTVGSKIERTRAAAQRCGATIIFKGADSVIATPDGRVSIAPAAPSWLASAGTGDVLAGMTAAMLATGRTPIDAAQTALWLHGEAARRAGPGLIADDLIAHIAPALVALT